MTTTNDSTRKINSGQGCHGGVFVYKNDNRVAAAWTAVEEINAKQMVCGELHKNRETFLAGLQDWNNCLEDENAYLVIYAHMGSSGISCYGRTDGTAAQRKVAVISWHELGGCFSKKLEMIWLLGCKSKAVLDAWKATQPAKYLLVTSESKNYVGFLPNFAAEINLAQITPYDQMPSYLDKHSLELAKHTDYYHITSAGYTSGFTDEKSGEKP